MSPMGITMFCNVGSLALGIVAWAVACAAIFSRKIHISRSLSAGSFCLCAFSLLLQLVEVGNRTNTGDFSAIMDTIRAVIMAACVLLIVTIVLNAVAYFKLHRTGEKGEKKLL